VPRGWSHQKRFKNSLTAQQENSLIKHSTDAHPFSPAYPYAACDTTSKATGSSARVGSDAAESPPGEPAVAPVAAEDDGAKEKVGKIEPPRDIGDETNRKNPIRTADLNCQYFKYSSKPQWGFGSSGLGYRFTPGTAFSRHPHVKTSSRLRGFRERREEIPEASEKEYQDALAKALAEATGSIGPPSDQATPVNKPLPDQLVATNQ
jgi:hypothetical protein